MSWGLVDCDIITNNTTQLEFYGRTIESQEQRHLLPSRTENKKKYIYVFPCVCFVRFATQFRGGTLGSRMEKMSSSPSPLQINKPAAIWRGGFKMPPRRAPASPHDRQQQQQQYQHQHQHHRRAETAGTVGGGGRRNVPLAASSAGGGSRNIGASRSQLMPASDSMLGGAGVDPKLPGIPNMLDSAGENERGSSAGAVGVGGRGARVSVGSLTMSTDAPHRGRFVRQR